MAKEKPSDPMALAHRQPENLSVSRPSVLSGIDLKMLFDKAVDSKAAVEILKELRAMELDHHERSAKAAFDEAMTAFQSECPTITKERAVPDASGKTAYKFAPIEAIEIQIRPLLRQHGFSHTFDTDTASADGWVIAKCIVTHSAGHSRISTAKFPLGTKTKIMSDTQQFAAALTFANRRALQNAYGLVLAGEDMDGNTGKIKPHGPSSMQPTERGLKEYAEELWGITKSIGGSERTWNARNQWVWREEILDAGVPETAPNLTIPKIKEVIAKAKEKLK
jgi:hypothetical protein